MKTSFAQFKVTFYECKHDMLYSPIPRLHDLLWCDTCKDYRTCKFIEKAFRMECVSCAMTRQYGIDKARMEQVARKHLRDYPRHKVYLVSDGTRDEIQIAQDPDDIVT